MTIDDCRRFYAEEVSLAAQISSPALVEALASVPRERFLGPGPWRVGTFGGLGALTYSTTQDANPRHIYHNVLVALDETRRINMGHPGAVVSWIDALDLKPGNHVFHLGSGVGYYTAVIAEVVGAGGRVIACEVDPVMAARAMENLRGYENVELHAGDGITAETGEVDAALINAGVTHPQRLWLTRLRDGGRLVLPLTVGVDATIGQGVMAKITRTGDCFAASPIGFAMIYHCLGGRDQNLETVLGNSLAGGALLKMQSVRVDSHAPVEACIVHTPDVCLSLAAPA